jgi:sec-independent protein translocase protein TatC
MKMTLMGHFRELKSRVAWTLAVFCAAFAAGLFLAPFLQDIATAPLAEAWPDPTVIYTGIADGLTVEFSLAGLFALLVSLPFALWQMWMYVEPALKNDERRIAAPFVMISPVLFVAGAAFAYFVLFPMMFRFFISVGAEGVAMMPDMRNYLSFSVDMMRAFGLAFQFPLALILLNRAGVVSKRGALSAGRYVIVGIFAVAAALTPPDVVSQIAMAAPLVLLFGLSFLFMV